MRRHRQATAMVSVAVAIVVAILAAGQVRDAKAVLPPGNTVAQWDRIAEDTAVGSGAFQIEGFIYMHPPSLKALQPKARAVPAIIADRRRADKHANLRGHSRHRPRQGLGEL